MDNEAPKFIKPRWWGYGKSEALCEETGAILAGETWPPKQCYLDWPNEINDVIDLIYVNTKDCLSIILAGFVIIFLSPIMLLYSPLATVIKLFDNRPWSGRLIYINHMTDIWRLGTLDCLIFSLLSIPVFFMSLFLVVVVLPLIMIRYFSWRHIRAIKSTSKQSG